MELYAASKVIIANPEKDKTLIKRSMNPMAGYESALGRVEDTLKQVVFESCGNSGEDVYPI